MANTKKLEADKAAEEARERETKRNEADTEFRETVRKAGEKRAKVYADTGAGNIAEQAWNDTRDEDTDPPYNEISFTKRQQLDAVVEALRTSGNADVVGLEEFEARAKELLVESGVEPGSAGVVPGAGPGRGEEVAAVESASTRRGALPEDFPHRAVLADSGYDTYAKVRGLKGDYSGVSGVGEVYGKEIDDAL